MTETAASLALYYERFPPMAILNNLICPVSSERVDENKVRATAFLVVILTGLFLITGHVVIPALLVVDYYLRAFTRFPNSPLSYLAQLFVKAIGTGPVWIDKAPKVFAARIGLLLTTLTSAAVILGMSLLATVTGTTLVAFAFLECGLNFCAGCWVYTYIVFPLVRKDR
jgi:hypothetical protein